MKLAHDLSRRQAPSLPFMAGILLLLVRPMLLGYGSLSVVPLALIYISLLGLSRSGVRARRDSALVPLVAGVTAIVSVWFAFAPASHVGSTTVAVLLSVLAAVAEEAFFRGALFDRLQTSGESTALLVSALAFALLHVPLYGITAFPIDLGAGLLFSWQRSESGSWEVPAATHALANVMAVVR